MTDNQLYFLAGVILMAHALPPGWCVFFGAVLFYLSSIEKK